ncbi:MAG TPA: hopanoid-associated sugar epimerase [Dongiaceae bacterium]|nr:hopanoid-associated sugar epimerase [Dongiaceae bacterium]
MKTLVTGASGFVGSAVLRRLVEAGHRVRALVRPTSDRRNLAGVECEVATGDLDDRAALDRAVAGCDALFHVAADYRLWVTDAAAMYRSNVEGTRQLMLAAAEAGVRRIVYTSSVATLGLRPDGTPADEATAAGAGDMIGHYKKSKFLAEAEVRRLIETEGLPAVIVKPSTPFGPRDVKPTPTGRVVVEAAAGRMPAYVDTGLNVVHVEDVAAGHLLAFERGGLGESYILGGEDMTLRALLETVAELAGRRPPRLRVPHWAVLPVAYAAEAIARRSGRGDPIVTVDGVRMSRKRMYFSSDKARRDLGYAPRPGAEALRDALDWFRASGYLD